VYTQCPYCETVYPLPPRLLAEGRGRILCGVCDREFNALDRLRERDDYASRPHPTDADAAHGDDEPAPEQGDLFAAALPQYRPAPAFVGSGRPPGQRLAWAGSALLLALLLTAQIGYAQRVELAADARARPWMERICAQFGCVLPAWREPQRLQLLAREIGPHPSSPDALLVTATVRNPGPWRQAWPLLELALSDLDGRPLALRRFRPEEYLGGAPQVDALEPDQGVLLRLELQDPGKEAVAFAFEFR
jgi:hypothetical protein